jgi:hypothetical protein
MRSGMTANVTLLVALRENVLVLPAGAVRHENGQTSVQLIRRGAERL